MLPSLVDTGAGAKQRLPGLGQRAGGTWCKCKRSANHGGARDLEKRYQQDQKEIKAIKQDLRRKEKALAV